MYIWYMCNVSVRRSTSTEQNPSHVNQTTVLHKSLETPAVIQHLVELPENVVPTLGHRDRATIKCLSAAMGLALRWLSFRSEPRGPRAGPHCLTAWVEQPCHRSHRHKGSEVVSDSPNISPQAES